MDEKNNIVQLTPMEARRRDRFDRKQTATAEKMLRRVRDLTHCPQALTPFLDTLSQVFVDRQDVVHPKNVPTVGTYCVMVPPELIYAQGAMPVKLCGGSYTAFAVGDDTAPRDACPLVKAVMGFEDIDAMPAYQNCALMAVPVTCDCKKKLAGWLQERRPTAILHVPANRDQDAGVVYHVLRGCLVYDYEYAAMEAEMEKLGIPIIRVETDYNEEDVEQLRIRIEAFIELIKYGGNDT